MWIPSACKGTTQKLIAHITAHWLEVTANYNRRLRNVVIILGGHMSSSISTRKKGKINTGAQLAVSTREIAGRVNWIRFNRQFLIKKT